MTLSGSTAFPHLGTPTGITTRSRRTARPSTVEQPDEFSFPKTLKLARRGDGRAFESLFLRFSPRVMAFCRSRGAEDPEGITNEVFLAVFRSIDGFQGSESAFIGWIFQITRNKIVDAHRRATVRPTLVLTDTVEPGGSGPLVPHESAEDAYLAHSLSPELATLLSCVEDAQREVIMLRVVAGLSFKEVGVAVGKSPAAAKQQYRRAIASLQRSMVMNRRAATASAHHRAAG